MTQSQHLIEINNVSVWYAKRQALHDIHVTMPFGGIGLLGPNGAGKSTLLKTIMGFLKPSTGSMRVLNYDPQQFGAETRRMIGYMPEDDCYIPGMSAVEFVSYCGQLNGLPKNEAMLRAHLVLHYCGLGEARYRKVETFSTGMKQRVKLAQALVHDPKLLLLDEPTNGLDPQGRQAMLELILDITKQKGISVLLSSHILPDVEMVCEHVMVLFKGGLATAGEIGALKKLAQFSYEVRVKGDAQRFTQEIQKRNGVCSPKKNGLLQVQMREEQGTQAVYEAAHEAGVQLRQIVQEEMTLQDVFSKAIEEQKMKQR